TADASVTSKTWFTSNGFAGTPFMVNADGGTSADDPVAWAVVDTFSKGLYDTINLSMNDTSTSDADTDFNDGNTSNDRVGQTENDDEVAILGDSVIFGDSTFAGAPWFSVSRLDGSPVGDIDPALDVGLTSPWYTGTFDIDIDGDQVPETLDFVIVDPGDSDGLYTKVNFDRDDSGSYSASEEHDDDELIMFGGMRVRLNFETIGMELTLTQGRITNVVQVAFNRFLIYVPADANLGDEQDNVRIGIAMPDDAPPCYIEAGGTFTVLDGA
ncbi:MAG: hypothetical protein HN837_07580, partial [Chloroflexi bacterium]|nr:hypothetical protein [Chloroflexota bacterium]